MSARSGPSLSAIVLAAGRGKRFKSSRPKVLHEVCGLPMVAHAVRAVAAVRPARTVVVVGRDAGEVAAAAQAASRSVSTALQQELLGTADAARTGEEALGRGPGDILVVPGDTPLLRGETLRRLVGAHRRRRAAATLLVARVADPRGYGRIIRAEGGLVERIVEETDATSAQRRITEVCTGVWVFDRALLRSSLAAVERDNAQGELYLTDVVAVLRAKGERVEAVETSDPDEIIGVNSRAQLATAGVFMRSRINARHLDAGVTIVDPAQTFIDADVRIGRDTVVLPLSFLHSGTRIGAGCEIGPSVRISDSRISDGARVQFSVLDRVRVGEGAAVGPYSYLRPGTRLDASARAGAFVEMKATRLGRGSKAPHLSYLGDAVIGSGVNIGAGTITCNYDGEHKHRTVVGDGAFVGSDTMLVAPVRIGPGAYTAAGSAITEDVPEGALGIARERQVNVKGWAARRRGGPKKGSSKRGGKRT